MPRGRVFAIVAIVLLLILAIVVGLIIWMRRSPTTPVVPPPINGANAGVAKPIKIPVTKPVGGAPPQHQGPIRRPVAVSEATPTYRVAKGKAA